MFEVNVWQNTPMHGQKLSKYFADQNKCSNTLHTKHNTINNKQSMHANKALLANHVFG